MGGITIASDDEGEGEDETEYIQFMEKVKEDEMLCLDVGGERHFVKRGLLIRYPSTRLGRLARCAKLRDALKYCNIVYDYQIPEFFFDRNSDNFLAILDIYRTDTFHLTSASCALVIQKNMEYWGIDELLMEPCCALKYYPEIDTCVNEKQGDLKQKQKEKDLADEENFGNSSIGQFRAALWNIMEYPWTSTLAQFMAFFSLGMVVVSTLTFILSTMEDQEHDGRETPFAKALDVIDAVVIIYFTWEYVVRFLCAPRKWKFFKQPMNLIDFLAIIPFYLALFLSSLEDIQIIGKAGKIVRLIRVMRILRIFKLVRHFAGLQSLLFTLRQAYKELGLLIILVAIAILTFSSLVYFAEKEDKTDDGHGNIKDNSWTFVESFWWGLMTITTVGYDLNPNSFFGKLVGGFCALCGIFIMTLPVPIVVNSFTSYYKNRLWRNEVAQKKRERQNAQDVREKELKKFGMLRAMAAPMANIIQDPSKPESEQKKRRRLKMHDSFVVDQFKA